MTKFISEGYCIHDKHKPFFPIAFVNNSVMSKILLSDEYLTL